jgi:Fe-S-cluster containining protein
VGRKRKAFCEEFVRFKTKIFTEVADRQKQVAKDNGKTISCSNGCWFCCTQYVAGSLEECEAIVHWLYQHPDILDFFLKQYPKWRGEIGKNETAFKEVNAAAGACMASPENSELRETFLDASRRYHRQCVACPFLKDGACSIYPVRPFACAGLVAFTPPEKCSGSSPDSPEVFVVNHTVPDPAYYVGDARTRAYGPFALIVHQLLQNGYLYIAQLPGCETLEDDVFGDPEVRKHLPS